jgi:ketosteroid isomerase-like protein
MGPQKWIGQLLVIGTLISLSACSSAEPLKIIPSDEVASLGEACEVAYQAHVDAWNSREPENLRSVYTDDITHFDGEPLFVGIDQVLIMAKVMFDAFPDWQMEAGETFVSRDECLGTWSNWGVFGFTQDNPGEEYDLMEIRDSQIYYWRVFYDQNFLEAIPGPAKVDQEFLSQFASSWSGGDADALSKMYTQDAELEDTLFGVTITGTQAISAYAESFFATYPQASWELISSFAEAEASQGFKPLYPFSSQGGVFAINVEDPGGNPCVIHAALILTPDDSGSILTQKVFYNTDTLLACGWTR